MYRLSKLQNSTILAFVRRYFRSPRLILCFVGIVCLGFLSVKEIVYPVEQTAVLYNVFSDILDYLPAVRVYLDPMCFVYDMKRS